MADNGDCPIQDKMINSNINFISLFYVITCFLGFNIFGQTRYFIQKVGFPSRQIEIQKAKSYVFALKKTMKLNPFMEKFFAQIHHGFI